MRGQILNLRRVMRRHGDGGTPALRHRARLGVGQLRVPLGARPRRPGRELERALGMLTGQPPHLAHRRRLVVLLERPRRRLPVLRLRRAADRAPRGEAVLVPSSTPGPGAIPPPSHARVRGLSVQPPRVPVVARRPRRRTDGGCETATRPARGSSTATTLEARERVVELLCKAYWMEIETVMSYIAASVNLDGVRAQEIKESLARTSKRSSVTRAVRRADQGALRGRAGLRGLRRRAELPAAARGADRHRPRDPRRDQGRDAVRSSTTRGSSRRPTGSIP